ncbi:MAPK regulated corepressor interacting protein 2-like isoform X2 [Lutzomyia longipalpis]|uniref:MAPK regulated corepressor interacting protein 2-like isoform X2 n=1 Tax=Lutzomyia longipalpis TaxID=7200 RepID=UPI002483C309|nr:MAPK regulated corepressor interacting protein 2-like isoform X2 [Lutzomyia longipalpis]
MDRNMRPRDHHRDNAFAPSGRLEPPIRETHHDELIKYIQEAWTKVSEQGVLYKSVPESRLANFTPFDLESWWGRRMVQNVQKTCPHQ